MLNLVAGLNYQTKTRQTVWQGKRADKAEGLARQKGWQGKRADKAGGLTRQAG